MRKRIWLEFIAVTVLLVANTAHAQTAKDLVGTWQIVSNVTTFPDGKKINGFGPHGTGIAIFESNGYFVSLNNNPDVPNFASNNRGQGTPEENKAVVLGNLDLFGTYSVADKVITFTVKGSSYPNWMGTDQKRTIVSFTGDELTYAVPVSTTGGKSELTLKRIK